MGRVNLSNSFMLSGIAQRSVWRFLSPTMDSATILSYFPSGGRRGSRLNYSLNKEISERTGLNINVLNALKEPPPAQAVEGHYPVYTTHEDANLDPLGDGTSEPVVINAVTYYKAHGNPQGSLTVGGISPLYIDEQGANAASDDGQSHAHVVDDVTYWMPGATHSDPEDPADPEVPQAIGGYYPLYTTQEAAEDDSQGNGTSTSIVINDVTYYKPNEHPDATEPAVGPSEYLEPYYKYNEIPAENLTHTGEASGFSLRFGYREMINGYYVWNPELILANGQANNGYNIYNWRETPRAVVQSISPDNGYNGNVYMYGLDHSDYTTPKLFYKFIHNDFSQETDWYEIPVQETTGYVFIEAGWDPQVNHVLFSDEDGNQFAVFNQSVPTPLSAVSSPTVQFYEGGYSTTLNIHPSTVSATHVGFNVDGNIVELPRGSVLYTFVDYAINLLIHADYPSYLAVNKRNNESIGSSSSNWRDPNQYNITPTKWQIGDHIELKDQSNDEVVFTFVLTDDMSLGYIGGGYPTPSIQAPQAFHYTNGDGQVEIGPEISGNQITFYSAPTFVTDIDQHYYLYVPSDIDQIKINYPVWVRNLNKDAWMKTAAYISQGYGGINDRDTKWSVGDTLSIGSNSGSVQFHLTITDDASLAPP